MKSFYIGVDLGGTNVRFVAVEKGASQILCYQKNPFQRLDQVEDEVEENLFRYIDKICEEQQKQDRVLGGIGIALAALFHRETGDICKWPNNQKWNGFPIKKVLEKRYHVPVILEDDANSAAIGEQIAGAGIGHQNLVYITISTGIGSGIVVNDMLLTGEHGWAGELGHIKVTEEKEKCTCGENGCLQAVASGTAILRRYKERKGKAEDTFSLQQVAEWAEEGDTTAREVFWEAGTYIGKAIANVVMLLDIPLFILGGGVLQTGDLIYKPLQEAVSKSLHTKRDVTLVQSNLSDKNGLIGVLSLIDQLVNKKKTIYFLGGITFHDER